MPADALKRLRENLWYFTRFIHKMCVCVYFLSVFRLDSHTCMFDQSNKFLKKKKKMEKINLIIDSHSGIHKFNENFVINYRYTPNCMLILGLRSMSCATE